MCVMVAAVLFDMDGVLVRSTEAWFRVVEAAGVRFRGAAVTREEFMPTFGQGTAADLDVFKFRGSRAELDAFYVAEFPRYLESVWVNPAAAEVLRWCRGQKLATALVTNTVSPLADQVIGFAKLTAYFDSFATADRVAKGKPAPDLLVLAAAELKVSLSNCVMVGDSRYDREAAQAAGAQFVGLGLEAACRIEDLAHLPDVILKLK